jgi:cytochrome b561
MLRNTSRQWGLVSQGLHWSSAALVAFLLIHGLWMTQLATGVDRLASYATHASAGYFLLGLVMVRIVWRSQHAVPAHPADAPAWERRAARASHVALYCMLLGDAYVGWALAGTLSPQLDRTLFDLVRVPPITRSGNHDLHDALVIAHEMLAWTLVALITLHVAAAIYHWKIRRDDVMRRMIPHRSGAVVEPALEPRKESRQSSRTDA